MRSRCGSSASPDAVNGRHPAVGVVEYSELDPEELGLFSESLRQLCEFIYDEVSDEMRSNLVKGAQTTTALKSPADIIISGKDEDYSGIGESAILSHSESQYDL